MSRRRPRPEDVISAIYEEEGFYEVERRVDLDSGYMAQLILSDGNRELVVNILDEDAFLARGAVQDALLQAERLKGKFDGVVIAVPRKYQRAVDEDVMALHGFGLVIYDKLGAEEILPPRIREEGADHWRVDGKVEQGRKIDDRELVELRMEISRLIRSLEEVEARLDRLEREQKELVSRIIRLEAAVSRIGQVKSTEAPEVAGAKTLRRSPPSETSDRPLPSYLRDNPWVEILSRRGTA